MGNDQNETVQVVKMPTAAEIKTYIMIAQNRIMLFRNKKIDSIRKKKSEIVNCLKQNNLDVAKAKMDSLIRDEDYITAYDILSPLLEILKERVTYIITSTECPPDLRAQLDTVIYASTRVECEELYRLRDLIMSKYGSAYIQKADSNVDKLVNVNLIEKLRKSLMNSLLKYYQISPEISEVLFNQGIILTQEILILMLQRKIIIIRMVHLRVLILMDLRMI